MGSKEYNDLPPDTDNGCWGLLDQPQGSKRGAILLKSYPL